jgi:hypothetical protein
MMGVDYYRIILPAGHCMTFDAGFLSITTNCENTGPRALYMYTTIVTVGALAEYVTRVTESLSSTHLAPFQPHPMKHCLDIARLWDFWSFLGPLCLHIHPSVIIRTMSCAVRSISLAFNMDDQQELLRLTSLLIYVTRLASNVCGLSTADAAAAEVTLVEIYQSHITTRTGAYQREVKPRQWASANRKFPFGYHKKNYKHHLLEPVYLKSMGAWWAVNCSANCGWCKSVAPSDRGSIATRTPKRKKPAAPASQPPKSTTRPKRRRPAAKASPVRSARVPVSTGIPQEFHAEFDAQCHVAVCDCSTSVLPVRTWAEDNACG